VLKSHTENLLGFVDPLLELKNHVLKNQMFLLFFPCNLHALNLFGPHAKDMQHLTTSLTKREALQTIKVTNLRISSSTKVFFRKVHKRRKLSEEKLCSNLRRVQTYKG
jgi:hypothetical protein